MMKKGIAVAAIIILAIGILTPYGYADHCPMMKGGGQKDGLEEKFCHKAHFILENEEDLGLSDEQIGKIKDLKLETRKDLIKKDAEIETLALDIKAKLSEDVIDTKSAGELIDRKYELKKEKAKAIVEAIASLKNTLTEEQRKKLKGLWKKCKK